MTAFLQNEVTATPTWGLALDDEKEADILEELPQVNIVRRLVSLPALQEADPEKARERELGSQPVCSQSVEKSILPQDKGFGGNGLFWLKEVQLQRGSCSLPIAEVAASKDCEAAEEAATNEATTQGAVTKLNLLPTQRRAEIGAPLVLQKTGLRVALAANGSLGDMLPFLTLSLQLMQFHHTVCMFTSANLVSTCVEHGVPAVPIFADSLAVISKIGGMVADMNQGLELSIKAAKEWMEENPTACVPAEEALNDFQPDAIVSGAAALKVSLVHEVKRVVPVVPTFLSSKGLSEFKSYCSLKPRRPSFFAVNNFLTQKPVPVLPGLHHTSEWVNYRLPSKNALAEGGPLYALQRFLQTGPAPVAVGWGSMIACGLQPVEMLGLVLGALRCTGHRGVVLGGWAELDKLAAELTNGSLDGLGKNGRELSAYIANQVCFIREAPHEWLFPQCRSVVHHGGIGTTHSALRAGKPAVITPVFADQFTHAELIERLDVGVGFKVPLSELTSDDLARAIESVESKATRADSLGQKMRMQTGERDAAAVLDKFLRKEVQTGVWAKSIQAQKGKSKGSPGGPGKR